MDGVGIARAAGLAAAVADADLHIPTNSVMSLRAAQMFELDAEDHHSRLTAAFSANRRNSDLARAVSSGLPGRDRQIVVDVGRRL